MENKILNCPAKIKPQLYNKLNTWNSPYKKFKNYEELKDYVKEPFAYLLKMYWMGRFDKMSESDTHVLEWVSGIFLNEDFSQQVQNRQDNEVAIKDINLDSLASKVFDDLWICYEQDPNIKLPFSKETSKKKWFKFGL
jgi:hypothetical protein